jgi:2-hydroxy-6-oxonona-2,4-dienedioate hydrolase
MLTRRQFTVTATHMIGGVGPVKLLLLSIVIGAGVWIGWRFHDDVTQARERAMRGGTVISTRCGPIEYEEAGDIVHGAPLLMIHGSGGGHDQGMLFARGFAAQGIRVIAPSRFGYLGTPLPADASPPAQADAHACLLDALGIPRAAVLGASAGALSAMQLAIRHPQRIGALVLLVPLAWRPATAADAPPPSEIAQKLLLSLIGSDFVYWSAMHVARDQVIARVLATPPALVAATSPAEQARVGAMIDSILPVSARTDGLRNETKIATHLEPFALESIRAPTLLISTRDDGYGTYASAEYVASRITDAKFIGFDQGGHLWVGHHEEVLRAVLAHVTSHTQP